MPPRLIHAFVALLVLAWLAWTLWLLEADPPAATLIALSLAGFSFAGIFLWVIYFIILSVTVLPKVDQLAYPDSYNRYKNSDNALLKIFRANSYTAAIQRKSAKHTDLFALDLREIPSELKTPLKFHIRLLTGSFSAGILGFLILEFFT